MPLPLASCRLASAAALLRGGRVELGEDFVEHYAGTREWETRQFEKAVTDWELARYLESI